MYWKEAEVFRELTKKVIAGEKDGFWSDWTKEQQYEYVYGDWESFSRSRGYGEEEIEDFRMWLNMIDRAAENNINALVFVKDLVLSAAYNNILKDKYGEIALSSHLPKRIGG